MLVDIEGHDSSRRLSDRGTRAGNSKGLPGKNIKPLAGHPLIAWTLAAVKAAGLDSARCVLSTDNDQIAEVGKSVGYEVPFLRPAELATDTASTVDAVLHCVDWYAQKRGSEPGAVMLLQPTSPIREPELLTAALGMLEEPFDAVVGTKAIKRSLSTLFYRHDDERLEAASEGIDTAGRQAVAPLFTPNGALYVVRTDVLRKQKTFFPPRSRSLEMSKIASIDIDTQEDFDMAQAVIQAGMVSYQP